jgi:hypothetical protein
VTVSGGGGGLSFLPSIFLLLLLPRASQFCISIRYVRAAAASEAGGGRPVGPVLRSGRGGGGGG